jgi:hypothetical protein
MEITPSFVELKTNVVSSRLDAGEDTSSGLLMKNSSSQNPKQSKYQESKHTTNSGNPSINIVYFLTPLEYDSVIHQNIIVSSELLII